MPVYNIPAPASSRNAWAEGVKSLADAFAPDPRMAVGMAQLGLEREKFDFESGIEQEKLGLLRNETAAQIEQLEAAAYNARANGDRAAEQIFTEKATQLKLEAETAKFGAETREITAQTDAGDRMVELATSPDANPNEMFALGARGDATDISLADAIVATSPDGEMPANFEPALMANGTSFQNTATGAREGWAQELIRKQAEPVTVTEDSNVFLAPDDPRRLSPENPLLPGQTSVADTEQVIPVNVPGAPVRPTITGPNFVEDPDDLPVYDPYTFSDPNTGQPVIVPARVMPDGSVRDRQGVELPMTAFPIAKPQITDNAGGLGKLTESGAKTADLVPQVIMGVQDMNDLVGYDIATDDFKEGGTFPGISSVVGNTVESLVGAVAGKELGAYAGLVTRKDFDNEYDYQMFRVTEPLLRFRSGAATPEEEVARYRMYAPRAGDSRELAQRKIRDLNRLASSMAYVAQQRNIPVMDVVSSTTIIPGSNIMDPQMRMEVERALAAGQKPTEAPAVPEVPAATPPRRWTPG